MLGFRLKRGLLRMSDCGPEARSAGDVSCGRGQLRWEGSPQPLLSKKGVRRHRERLTCRYRNPALASNKPLATTGVSALSLSPRWNSTLSNNSPMKSIRTAEHVGSLKRRAESPLPSPSLASLEAEALATVCRPTGSLGRTGQHARSRP